MASSSSSEPCSICLEPVKQEAFLDRCLHSFCYDCVVRWSRLVIAKESVSSIKCPLCKTENFSILYNFDGESFRQRYVNENYNKSWLSSAHEFRLLCYNNEGGFSTSIFDVQKYWKLHRYLQSNKWLQSWLRREIQSLTEEEDADIIVHHIRGVVEAFRIRKQEGVKAIPEKVRDEFKSLLSYAVRPFILGQTVCFINELEQFLASGLNIEAYDKACLQALRMSPTGLVAVRSEEVCDPAYRERYLNLLDEHSSD